MKAHGFDAEKPIPVNQDWSLLDGAHRTACASALDIKAHIQKFDTDHSWPEWGKAWFEAHGMAGELPGILADFHAYGED